MNAFKPCYDNCFVMTVNKTNYSHSFKMVLRILKRKSVFFYVGRGKRRDGQEGDERAGRYKSKLILTLGSSVLTHEHTYWFFRCLNKLCLVKKGINKR